MRCLNCGFERRKHNTVSDSGSEYCPETDVVDQKTFTTRFKVQDRDE